MVSASTVQKVSLRGRDADRAAIATLLAATADGRGGALVVAGPVGIGRTALLAGAVLAPAVELTVSGCPAETLLPYAGLHRLLAGRVPGFGCDGAARHDGAMPDRLAVGLATLAALRGLGGKARGPVVCRIDDAQWLDRPSLDALALAARRAGGDRVALLFALRDTPSGAGSEAALAGLPYRRLAPSTCATAATCSPTRCRTSPATSPGFWRAWPAGTRAPWWSWPPRWTPSNATARPHRRTHCRATARCAGSTGPCCARCPTRPAGCCCWRRRPR
ncbi:ATP-binding protein [Dactylosporangium cerinum]